MSHNIYKMHADATTVHPVSSPVDISPTNPQCLRTNTNSARLDPAVGRVMFGASLDWSYDTPILFSKRVGIRPAVTNAFMPMTPSATAPLDFDMLTWHVQQVSLTGGILQLSLVPSTLAIPDAAYLVIAYKLRQMNSNYGVPIMLRFGHEMNGNWLPYGYQPVQYIQAFRKLAQAIQAQTNLTAMVWAPNVGLAYPYLGALTVSLPTVTSDPANFAALDSNHDGVINGQDDPYGPYYPGNDVVDWVGLSLYWYEMTGVNNVVSAGYIASSITGDITGAGTVGLNLPLRNFYGRFAQGIGKPMALSESGMPWAPNLPVTIPGMTELLAKQSWWSQIFSTTIYTQFPLLKLVVNFEESKSDGGVGAALTTVRDWRYGNQTAIWTSFTGFVQTQAMSIALAGNVNFQCNGVLTLS
ncbi:hypothetical protein BASA81_017954 [Batrachochytrium salamandrivorans]|nr:hypothetical protein BASA81_017954 [Batrachochytrium salamandrivorans]